MTTDGAKVILCRSLSYQMVESPFVELCVFTLNVASLRENHCGSLFPILFRLPYHLRVMNPVDRHLGLERTFQVGLGISYRFQHRKVPSRVDAFGGSNDSEQMSNLGQAFLLGFLGKHEESLVSLCFSDKGSMYVLRGLFFQTCRRSHGCILISHAEI